MLLLRVTARFLGFQSSKVLGKSTASVKQNLNYYGQSRLSSTALGAASSTGMPYPSVLATQPPDAEWKEAASLIILVPDQTQTKPSSNLPTCFDYNLLMVRRSFRSSFMASAVVFPGGAVELSDFDPKWLEVFARAGVDRSEVDRFCQMVVGPRPPLVTDALTLKKARVEDPNRVFIHADIGLRISAIRETFEEAGILLLTKPTSPGPREQGFASVMADSNVSVNLAEWQLKVRNDSRAFMELCDHLQLVPDIWSLYEWSNWLTPLNVGHRRFDTIFYVCALRQEPNVSVDNAEVFKPQWSNPSTFLRDHSTEQIFLVPPQAYELSRMLRFNHLSHFIPFLATRQVLGTERWLPVMLADDDKGFFLLPGDDRYPSEPEMVSSLPVDDSLKEAHRGSKFLNRIELEGIRSMTFQVTIEPGCGHLAPVTYPATD